MPDNIDLLIKDFYGKFANKTISEAKILEIKNTYKGNNSALIKDLYGKFRNEAISDDKVKNIINTYGLEVSEVGKTQEVSLKGSKGTSQTSSEPSAGFQTSNPFTFNNTKRQTVDVATGKPINYEIGNAVSKVEKKKGIDAVNSLGSGMANLSGGITKLPRFIYDAVASVQNLVSEKVFDIESKADYDDLLRLTDIASRSLGGQIFSPLTLLDNYSKGQFLTAKEYDAKKVKYEQGIFDSLKSGNYADAGSQIVNSIIESAPSMALMAMTSGTSNLAGLSYTSRTVANALPFASSKSEEIKDSDIPDYVKPVYSLANGLTEVIFDQSFGSQAIINRVVDSFQKEGADVAQKVIKDTFKGYIEQGLKKSGEVVTDITKNSIEEMTTQLSQNLLEKLVENPDKDVLEGVVDAGIVGGAMGGGLSVVGAVSNVKIKKSISEKNAKIDELNKDLDSDIVDSAKEVIYKEVQKLKKEIEADITKANQEFEVLDEKDKVKAIEIATDLESIDNSLKQENISEQAKEILENKKEDLEVKLEEINKKGKQVVIDFNQNVNQSKEGEVTETGSERKPTEQVEQGQEIPTESKQKEIVSPKINDEVELPSQLEGTLPSTMVFTEDGWKEKVGRELSEVSKTKQNQAQQAFDKINNTTNDTVEVKEETATPPTAPIKDDLSGIKVGLVPQETVDKVDIERLSDKDMKDLGATLRKNKEVDAKAIVQDIAVNRNDRALQPKEVVALLDYKRELDNTELELEDKLSKAIENGSEASVIENLERELSDVNKDISEYNEMALITGQQQSLAFRLRRLLLAQDFSLAKAVSQYKKVNKGVIDEKTLERFKELDKKYQQVTKDLEKARIDYQNLLDQAEVDKISQSVKEEKSKSNPKRAKAEANLKKAKEGLSAFIKKSRGQAGSFADVAGFTKEVAKVIKAYADLGIINLQEVLAELRKDFGKDFVKDNQDVIEQAFNDTLSTREVPTINSKGQLVVPNSYTRGLVASGITQIQDLVDAVRDAIPESNSLTDREIRDAITNYGREVGRTKNQLQSDIAKAKNIGNLISKLEDLENKVITKKDYKPTAPVSEEVKELRKMIKNLEEQLPKTQEHLEALEDRRLNSKKEYYKRYIAEKQRRLVEGDFSKKEALPAVKADAELNRLETEARNIREEYEFALKEAEFKNKSLLTKAITIGADAIQSITRDILVGIDLGVAGVQLSRYLITHPSQIPKVVNAIVKAFTSQKFSDRINNSIQNSPNYDLMKKSGLALQFEVTDTKRRDFEATSSFVSKAYDFLIDKVVGTGLRAIERASPRIKNSNLTENTLNSLRALNLFKRGSRAFSVPVNLVRANQFNAIAELLAEQGKTFKDNPQDFKDAASATNILTFHGSLYGLEGSARILSNIFFAARKITATVQQLNPFYLGYMYLKNPTVGEYIIKDTLKYISIAFITSFLAKLANDEREGYDTNPDYFNPYSSDFLKVRFGHTRISFFAGTEGFVVFIARFVSRNYKRTSKLDMERLGQDSYTPTRLGLLGEFTENKLSPFAGMAVGVAKQREGREFDYEKEVLESLRPMWYSSIDEFNKDQPYEAAGLFTLVSIFGASTNTYGMPEFLNPNDSKDDKYIDLVLKNQGSFTVKNRVDIKKYYPNKEGLSSVTTEDYDNYRKAENDFLRDVFETQYAIMNKMDSEEYHAFMKEQKKSATKYAKTMINIPISDPEILSDSYEGKTTKYKLTREQIQERLDLIESERNRLKKDLENTAKYFVRKDKVSLTVGRKLALVDIEEQAEKFAKERMIKKYWDSKKGKMNLEKE